MDGNPTLFCSIIREKGNAAQNKCKVKSVGRRLRGLERNLGGHLALHLSNDLIKAEEDLRVRDLGILFFNQTTPYLVVEVYSRQLFGKSRERECICIA